SSVPQLEHPARLRSPLLGSPSRPGAGSGNEHHVEPMDTRELVRRALEIGAVQVPEEIEQLVDLVRKEQPRNILEIGSEAGGTLYLWCQNAALGGKKISVDLPTGSSGSGKFSSPEALAARTALFTSWSANVHVINGDSHSPEVYQEVRDRLTPDKTIDFL